MRQWTSANGALLVADEVITYRSEYSGAQQWFQARPDLTALGKMIGGGFPVGAIAGRAEVMEVFNPLADNVPFSALRHLLGQSGHHDGGIGRDGTI